MSNIFTYEIDERNLRIQLKSMEVPLKDEAWHKFEAYSDAHPFEQPRGRFKKLEINLNRSVVLPAVFGVIICLFSFLLFNFITIKNPSGRVQQMPAADRGNNVTVVESKAAEIIPASTNETILTSEVSTVPAPEIVAVPEASTEAIVSAPAKELTVQENAVNLEVPVKTIRHKRRNREEEEALSAIKPTIVSDEADSGSEPVPASN